MLAVDTNVVLRVILDDDPAQSRIARQLLEHNEVWVSRTVVLETEWVLRSAASLAPQRIHFALTQFLQLPQVVIEDVETIAHALDCFAQGMDFADALHLAASGDCTAFASFDRRLSKAARKAGSRKVMAL